MRIRLVYVALILLFLFPVAAPADEQEPSASRWGITTKKDLEAPRKTAPDNTESTPDKQILDTEARPSIAKPATSPLESANTGMIPAGNAPANADGAIKIEPTKTKAPEKNVSANKVPSTDAAKKEIIPQAINWSSEKQKERCNEYLEDLRSLFLITRHFSIQGASRDTAVSATAFLKSMDTCEQNCPQGLLEHSGYNKRIIRNIRYLEKLGNDRCSGTLTPVAPMTKTP